MTNILTQLMGTTPERPNEPVFYNEGARRVEITVMAREVLADTAAAIGELRAAPSVTSENVVQLHAPEYDRREDHYGQQAA